MLHFFEKKYFLMQLLKSVLRIFWSNFPLCPTPLDILSIFLEFSK